jgi:molecular chaperone HtpG
MQILPNKDTKTLSIIDTGVGMTKEDLINNLGTVARSGTKAFMEHLKQNEGKLDLIGQFGVGFYSAYLVANEVTVITKNNNDKAYIWQSSSDGKFTITESEDQTISRGTKIILNIKEDCLDYLNESELTNLVKRHSQYISFPIELFVERSKEEEIEEEEVEVDDEEVKVEEVAEDEKVEEKKKTKTVNYTEWTTLNDQQPIWTRKPDDISKEEYEALYKNLSNENSSYSKVKHFAVEGNVEFSSILFIPESKPFDMFNGGEDKVINKIKLYVRKVFITENNQDLMPEYLNFVVGVADSNDLPLNVSR